MKVGFIGLGNMGLPMAANLLKAGHELTVYNRTPEKAKSLVEQGARLAKTPADTCKGDVVFTMLSDDSAVEKVVFGESGVIGGLNKGAIHISSSTISVALSERLTIEHAKHGERFVSAPVFGRPEAAAAAKLFVVAAGPADTADKCMALFEVIGQKTFRFGDKPSSANLVKLSGNFLIASTIESLSEVMALVAKGGLDQRQYLDFSDLNIVRSACIQNLWRIDCREEVHASRVRSAIRAERCPASAGCGRRLTGSTSAS